MRPSENPRPMSNPQRDKPTPDSSRRHVRAKTRRAGTRAARASEASHAQGLGLSLAVLGVGLVGAWFLIGSARDGKKKPHTTNANAASPSNLLSSPRSVVRALSGVVVDETDTPIAGALVFLIPKGYTGTTRDRAPHVHSSAKGTWRFRPRRLDDMLVGFLRTGHVNTYLPASEITSDGSHRVTMPKCPALAVRLVDEQDRPIANCAVGVTPSPPLDLYDLPGPDGRRGERWLTTDERGNATCFVGSDGPITISPILERHVCAEPRYWLESPHREITLRTLPSCRVVVSVASTEGVSLPQEGALRWRLANQASAWRMATAIRTGNTFDFRAIPRRPIDAEFLLSGARPVTLPGLDLSDAQDAREVAATVLPAVSPGTVRLTTSGGRGAMGFPRVYVRRVQSDAPWVFLTGAKHDEEEREITFSLPPGTYRALVVESAAKKDPARVGMSHDFEVQAGGESSTTVATAPGTIHTVDPSAFRPGHVKAVDVHIEGMGPVPLYGRYKEHRRRFGEDLLAWINSRHAGGVVLGPYPGGKARVRFRRHKAPRDDK